MTERWFRVYGGRVAHYGNVTGSQYWWQVCSSICGRIRDRWIATEGRTADEVPKCTKCLRKLKSTRKTTVHVTTVADDE